jgi:lauroyl/myristoyl acyltransferase
MSAVVEEPNPLNKDRSRSLGQRSRTQSWHRKDLLAFTGLPLQLLIADALPEALWAPLARLSALIRAHRQPAWRRREVTHIARYLGHDPADPGMTAVLVEMLAALRLAQWWTLAARRPDGWRPRVRLEGSQHLDRALERGHGAILWVAPFLYAPLAAKVAIWEYGYQVVHLSRALHGGEVKSAWGGRFISPLFVAGEQRFLADRAVIGVDGSATKPLLRLARTLERNGIVSITVHAVGDRPVEVPFLNYRLRVAPGAPTLARRTSSALLPVFALLGQDGVVQVTIEEALNYGAADQSNATMVGALARRLAPRVASAPGQFRWRGGVAPG